MFLRDIVNDKGQVDTFRCLSCLIRAEKGGGERYPHHLYLLFGNEFNSEYAVQTTGKQG